MRRRRGRQHDGRNKIDPRVLYPDSRREFGPLDQSALARSVVGVLGVGRSLVGGSVRRRSPALCPTVVGKRLENDRRHQRERAEGWVTAGPDPGQGESFFGFFVCFVLFCPMYRPIVFWFLLFFF